MTHSRRLTLLVFTITLAYLIDIAYPIPSGGVYPPEFTFRNGYWYDSWGYNRNYHVGPDGYLPGAAYESLGRDKDLAYQLGEQFKKDYGSRVRRAEAILDYVQEWTDYGYDVDNVFKNGIAQEEWAWNADEMAHTFNQTTAAIATGDCEDLTFLCATIYFASNIEVALVDAPGHVALLIWLPEYNNANYYWDIPNDERDQGWIWVEATGEANPLGWTPPDFSNGNWNTHILGFSKFNIEYSPVNPEATDKVTVKATVESQTSPVNRVTLTYQTPDNFNQTQMTRKENHYQATIPQQPDGTKVTFKIQATDNETFTSEKEFQYTVGQKTTFPPYLLEAAIILSILLLLFVGLTLTG